MNFNHEPVLLGEVLSSLGTILPPAKNGPYFVLDGTLGGAGHANALLRKLLTEDPSLQIHFLGFDRDPDALQAARERLDTVKQNFDSRLKIVTVNDNFRNMQSQLHAHFGPDAQADIVLVDLGVSSHQLDTAERGFSLHRAGPLDMRMDATSGPSARDLLLSATQDELFRIFRDYGEEPRARKLAAAVVGDREIGKLPFENTIDFAKFTERVLGYGHSRTSPAYRIFQALRIAVNDELRALEDLLDQLPSLLAPAGRVGLISFHSLEDRLVKQAYRRLEESEPSLGCEFPRGGSVAAETEQSSNPRARSARLRVFWKGENRRSMRRRDRES